MFIFLLCPILMCLCPNFNHNKDSNPNMFLSLSQSEMILCRLFQVASHSDIISGQRPSHGALQVWSPWETRCWQGAVVRSCLTSLCHRRPAGRRSAPSASCVNTCTWTAAPPTGRCTNQSSAASTTGRPTLCGPSWTGGQPSQSTRGTEPAAAPRWVL